MDLSNDGILELLYCVNLVVGITLISVGGVYFSVIRQYNHLTEDNINLLPTLIISAGLIVLFLVVFSIFVLWLTRQEEIVRHISLVIFPALIIMQMTIGIYGCIQARDTDHEMLTGIQKQMRREYKEIHKKYSESLNFIQKDLECCGVYDFDDYNPNPQLPASCCEYSPSNEYCEERKLKYQTGCAENVYEKVTRSIGVASNVAIGVSIIQVAGLICLGKICCDK